MKTQENTTISASELISQHTRRFRPTLNRVGMSFAAAVVLTILMLFVMQNSENGLWSILILIVAVLALANLFVTLIYLLRTDKTLDLHRDGFVLRRTNDGQVIQATRWVDVQDIQWASDSGAGPDSMGGAAAGLQQGFSAGGPVGAVIGAIIGGFLGHYFGQDIAQDTIVIVPKEGKLLRITAYTHQRELFSSLAFVPKEIWLPAARDALQNGQEVLINRAPGIRVTAEGMIVQKTLIPWENVGTVYKMGSDIKITYTPPNQGRSDAVVISLNMYRNRLLTELIYNR